MGLEILPLSQKLLALILMALLSTLRVLSDYVAFPLLSAIKSGRPKVAIPPVKDKFLMLSATRIVDKIQSGQLTSVQVVTAFVNRLREINPIVNAVTDERYRDAIEEAKLADAEIQRRKNNPDSLKQLFAEKPFMGLPITTKNALAVKGLGHESGLYGRKGYKAPEDSAAMATMRMCGAIPLAVTNTPELCLWVETNNKLFGRTRNPYNTHRTSGGSSGGEGAILAACGSPLGIGTDIAGSIRIPATYNGIFGLKPTINTVDIAGHYPMPKDILFPLLTAGPMSKFAEDLLPCLKALVGPEVSRQMTLDEKPDLSKLKVLYIEDFKSPIIPAATKELRKATHNAASYLAKIADNVPHQVYFPELAYSMEIYLTYLSIAKCPKFSEELAMLKGEISTSRELVKTLLGRSKHTLPALVVTTLEKLVDGRKESPIANSFYQMSKKLEKDVEAVMEDTVIVCPTLPDIAPYHSLNLLRPSVMAYTGIWNILGFPCVSVPMGMSREGVPLGVSIVAGKYKDNVCCEIALELEKKFGGWIPPFKA